VSIDPLEIISRLTFKKATAPEQVQARILFNQVYSRDVNYVPSDEFDEDATYLIALNPADELIASLRFLGPEFRPFEIERFYNLSESLSSDRTAGLVGRLSVRHDHRGVPDSILVHFGLLKLAVEYANQIRVTDLFLYTLPHLLNFYRSVFFRPVGCSFEYPPLAARMHIMRLDLAELERRCRQSGSVRAQLMLTKNLSNFIL
jgi:predicted GNAT family N-acyltransferase